MVEVGGLPGRRAVTQSAVAVIVFGGLIFSVASQAVRNTGVIEGCRLPGRRGVAGGTLPGEVIGRLILGMT